MKASFTARFTIMAAAFAVCLIVSNILAVRVWQIGQLGLQLSGADLIFPISYILNDCLTEVYGYRKSRLVIWLAFALSAITALVAGLACLLPMPFDEGSTVLAHSYNTLFAIVPRTTIASLLAFICGSTLNSLVLSKMKVATGGRRFWLRAVVSTMGGELLDSCIFIPIAYAGIIAPKILISMILTLWIVKIVYELALLPLTSLFVHRLKAKEAIDVYDTDISYNPFKISDI